MKLLVSFLLLFLPVFLPAQSSPASCRNTVPVKVRLSLEDTACKRVCCYAQLISENPAFIIESFTIMAGGEGFDGGIVEVPNRESRFTPAAQVLLNKLKKGSFVEFSCIRARYKNESVVHILQPLFLEF
ncbi:MAG: hypothetical protein ABW019_13560 [Chitinophagaceae bacterium]